MGKFNLVNFDQIREHLRNTDVGREIDFFHSNDLPEWNEVSGKKLAWLDAAVLYCDISGYTSLTNQNRNETVTRILIGFHSSMVRITNQCQGRVFSFAGDRVMSVFVSDDRSITIDNATTCALAMQSIVRIILPEEFEKRNFLPKLSCSIGLDYGRVLMGRFGAGQSTDVILVGDVANYAAKLQGNANSNETLVSTEVFNNFPNWMNNRYWTSVYINIPSVGSVRVHRSDTYLRIN